MPRFAPSFRFQSGKSSFEISLFDPSWLLDKEDLMAFIARLENLVLVLGDHRDTMIEFSCDGEFQASEVLWRSLFGQCPIMGADPQ